MAVNVVLSAAGVWSGETPALSMVSATKVVEIQTEVKLVEGRVNRLRTDFNRYFDPQKAKVLCKSRVKACSRSTSSYLDKTAPQLPQLPLSFRGLSRWFNHVSTCRRKRLAESELEATFRGS